MEVRRINIGQLTGNAGQIEGLPANPRTWTQTEIDRLAKSLQETPELFEMRPLLVYEYEGKYVILGGNLRYEGAKKNKAIVADFKAAAKKYKAFEFTGEEFAIIIPNKLQDLKREGKALNHCVGCAGYDQKMVKGQSFIAFLRHTDKIKKPFVTIEFETKSNKIVQIYGYHDSTPPEDVLKFAKAWERRVKKQWTTAQIG